MRPSRYHWSNSTKKNSVRYDYYRNNMPTFYDPRKRKYVESQLAFWPKPHTGVWKRGYKRKRLMWKKWRYYIREYEDWRKTVSFQWYDQYKDRVTHTVELGDWEMCRQYHYWNTIRKWKRKEPANDPFELWK